MARLPDRIWVLESTSDIKKIMILMSCKIVSFLFFINEDIRADVSLVIVICWVLKLYQKDTFWILNLSNSKIIWNIHKI